MELHYSGLCEAYAADLTVPDGTNEQAVEALVSAIDSVPTTLPVSKSPFNARRFLETCLRDGYEPVENIAYHLGFSFEKEGEGTLRLHGFEGDDKHARTVLAALAPWVPDGCYVAAEQPFYKRFLWTFEGGRLFEYEGIVTWQLAEDEEPSRPQGAVRRAVATLRDDLKALLA